MHTVEHIKPSISFGPGHVENAETVRVVAHVGEGALTVPAIAIWRKQLPQVWSIFPLEWVPVGLTVLTSPNPCVFAVSEDGRVGFGYGDFREELVDNSTEGPRSHGPLRDLSVIGHSLFAVGMGRQVYKRSHQGEWVAISGDILSPKGVPKVCGFNAISGQDEACIWAVGFFGEIFGFDGSSWKQWSSPTNVILHRVVTVSRNLAYATGQLGTLLKFDGSGWFVVCSDADVGNLWGATIFKGVLYVSSEKAIYRLANGDLQPLKIQGVTSFGHLHANDGVMWSFGTQALAWTEDGTNWQLVEAIFGSN